MSETKENLDTPTNKNESASLVENVPQKKSKKKYILLFILIFLFGGFFIWSNSLQTSSLWSAIPSGAGIVVGSEHLMESWKNLRESTWNDAISNSLSKGKKQLWENEWGTNSFVQFLLSDYKGVGAVYQTEKEGTAYLGAIDLGWKSKLTDHLRFIISRKFTLAQLGDHEENITVLRKGKNNVGYYFTYNNLLVFSSHKEIIKKSYASIASGVDTRILSSKTFSEDSLFELWMNPISVYSLFEEYFKEPQVALMGLGRVLGEQHWLWKLENDELISVVKPINHSTKLEPIWWSWSRVITSKDLLTTLPENVSIAAHWGLSNQIQKRRSLLEAAGIQPWKNLENRLKIKIEDVFDSWIGNEAAWVKLISGELKGKNSEVMLIKTDNPALASEQLRQLNALVEVQTLERFSELKYRGFAIGYIGVEELLPTIFGEAFNRIEFPYYTVLGNAVAFSNHPLSLKRLIDAKVDGRTIDYDNKNIPKSAFYIWGNGSLIYEDLPLWIKKEDLKTFEGSKTLFESVKAFEGVITPRGKYTGSSYFKFTYQEPLMNAIDKEKYIKALNALDEVDHEAYLDEEELHQKEAFKRAAPLETDKNNMIQFK
ncbi:hypothetical protein KMW28_19535 [Flammeovirga yaeyamensis]|uniref:DUF3352 domain-containing protein n=1 Tax=Flammeovirga yaeyamensis TaxID=367791 RepID=A0AAX1N2P6_9BACT|nr:hypothetical protein [Flammeovirga yaeyamensis]MBB3700817.1 hypothetical protein [Flammeovirga yaeyamensis]NMF37828.1 hypothetical protein [Flammeovirga yaeyamensis]QWG01810.1 hypothetical protein KMW28_19535 [Flammeovirga yaeyamensis]